MTTNNPLLSKFELPPFDQINTADYLPAIEAGIAEAKKEVEAIINNAEAPTFDNVIAALEFSGMQLNRVISVFSNMNSSNADTEIQQLAAEIYPRLSAFHNDITLNADLFAKVKTVYDNRNELSLTKEQQTVLENHYNDFIQNGALLNDSQKIELRSIDEKLSKLSIEFGQKLLKDSNAFQLLLTDEIELDGLSASVVAAAKEAAVKKGLEGWLFTLDMPSYLPFVTYAKNRALRKKMFLANGSKGFQNNENNTESILLELAKLKITKANLLGYATYADYKLQNRMAKNITNVNRFLQDLLDKSTPMAMQELEEMKAFAIQKDGITDFNRWDSLYYSEQMRKEKFHYDEEALRPYFSLDAVLNGVFAIAGELYNLSFSIVPDAAVYHPDVKLFKVTDIDSGKLVAHLYTDFFPRSTKRAGAWMSSFKDQYKYNGKDERPIVAITCNFTKPTGDSPSLLTHREVTTLFHEFGHALHGMLSDVTYPSISSPHVFWDFVELPSQLFENWCFEKESLEKFARHYQTGEIIPDALIEKFDLVASFQAGLMMLRQIGLGKIDFGWHAVTTLDDVKDVKSYETMLTKDTDFYPAEASICVSPAFSHIFQGGYSAGYYSYKWAEVLDADAFEYFKQKGIFNKTVADSFKNKILAAGGSAHPTELYVAFRGQEPSIEPLLKRNNLV